MKKRPLGLKIFSVLFILLGIFGLAIVISKLLQLRAMVMAHPEPTVDVLLPLAKQFATPEAMLTLPQFRAYFAVMIAILLGRLITGIGLLMVYDRARRLTLLVTVLSLFFWIFGNVIFWNEQPAWSILVIPLFWNTMILWYFLRPAVKAQFVKAATSDRQHVTS